MEWTPKIDQAMQKASFLHRDQVRKGTKCPYIIHPVAVMSTVAEYTNDEDTLVAALMHDTVEDTEYTPEELEKDFGTNVKNIVLGITIPDSSEWKSGRYAYIEGLLSAPQESLLIAAADKIHNAYSMYSYYADKKEEFSKSFGGSIEERIDVYQKIIDIIEERLDSPILDKLQEEFIKYKAFLEKQL